jgi:hypothetical protein
MLQITSSSIPMIKLLCERGAHVSAHVDKNAILDHGHHFVRTRFAFRSEHGTLPVFFCRCGEMALQHDDGGHTICTLTNNGSERELTRCPLDNESTAH